MSIRIRWEMNYTDAATVMNSILIYLTLASLLALIWRISCQSAERRIKRGIRMSLDRIVKSRLSPYWVDWIEKNKLLWTSPDSSTISLEKRPNNATTDTPGRNMRP